MEIFPAQYSTLSAVALKEVLQESYGLQHLSCKLLIRNVSDTYLVETPEAKYIFKIYRDAHRSQAEIRGEVALLNVLAERGAKVAYPLKDIQGSQLQAFNAIEGTRYGVLFTYAPGQVVTAMNEAQLRTVGREMAAVHNITAGLELHHPRKAYTLQTMLTGPLETFRPAFEGLEEEYRYLSDTVFTVIAALEQFDLPAWSYGYCHYDFLPKNFHFDAQDGITFFDFDFAGQGYLANDIASFYIHFFLEVKNGRLSREEADRAFSVFVTSYREVRTLTDEELRAIPYLGFAFWVFYLGFQYENFDDWSSIFFGPKFLRDRVALIRQWMAWF